MRSEIDTFNKDVSKNYQEYSEKIEIYIEEEKKLKRHSTENSYKLQKYEEIQRLINLGIMRNF